MLTCEHYEIFIKPILKNICERLLLQDLKETFEMITDLIVGGNVRSFKYERINQSNLPLKFHFMTICD